ncbi:MAG TPA: hypothetical protein VF668_01820, partial [Pyrinomonadaceae bacterium]
DDAEAEAARAELERKALALLDEALAEAAGLKLAENRVRAQLTAARLLWPRDPAAARAAFDAAAAGVADLSARVDPEDQQFYGAAQGVMQLRGEMLQLAGQYDPKAALDFLRASRPAYAEALAAAGYGQQEQTFELNLAAQIAAREPRRALEMAEESLSRGVTTGLTNVVSNLRSKDPAAAARLAAAAVKRLRADELPLNYEASAAAQNLLHMSRPEENQPAGQEGRVAVVGGPGRAGAVPLLDEQTRRELVNKVLAALPSVTTSQSGSYNLYQALQTILPEAERYAPGRAAALRRRAEELEGALNPQARVMRMYEEAMSAGTVEALLEAAAKAPPEARDALYTQAALKAFNEGPDAARAQEILEKVSNPQQRAQTRRSMEQQEQARAARQGDFAGARQAIARMSSADDRVAALLHLANQASAARDAQAARQALEEAQAVVEAQTRGQQQFGYRLQIAQAYAGVDAGAAFEAVEAAVARLDVMLDAAAEVDGFGYDSFKDGELKSQGGFYWQDFIQRCAQTLAALAPSDFERAAAAVKKFRRPEARTTAQLALVANLLGAPRRGRRNFHGDVTPLRLSGAGGR